MTWLWLLLLSSLPPMASGLGPSININKIGIKLLCELSRVYVMASADHARLDDLTLPPGWRWLPSPAVQLFTASNLPRLDMNFLLVPDAQLDSGGWVGGRLLMAALPARLAGHEVSVLAPLALTSCMAAVHPASQLAWLGIKVPASVRKSTHSSALLSLCLPRNLLQPRQPGITLSPTSSPYPGHILFPAFLRLPLNSLQATSTWCTPLLRARAGARALSCCLPARRGGTCTWWSNTE